MSTNSARQTIRSNAEGTPLRDVSSIILNNIHPSNDTSNVKLSFNPIAHTQPSNNADTMYQRRRLIDVNLLGANLSKKFCELNDNIRNGNDTQKVDTQTSSIAKTNTPSFGCALKLSRYLITEHHCHYLSHEFIGSHSTPHPEQVEVNIIHELIFFKP